MVNQVTLIGRICNELELQTSGGGTSFLRFTIACDRPGQDKKTDFIDCTALKNNAENMTKYLGKGSLVCVLGSIQCDTVEKDGQKRKYWKVIANRVVFLDKRGSNNQQQRDNSNFGGEEISFNEEDMPF